VPLSVFLLLFGDLRKPSPFRGAEGLELH